MVSVLSDVQAFGTIKGGRLFIRNRRSFNEDLRRFRDEEEVEIEVHRLKATRSLKANAFYFGIVLSILSDYTGHTVVELHEHFKQLLIPVDVILADRNGEVKTQSKIPGSTRKMNIQEFYAYVEQVRAVAADLGCVIPDPDGHYGDDFSGDEP